MTGATISYMSAMTCLCARVHVCIYASMWTGHFTDCM